MSTTHFSHKTFSPFFTRQFRQKGLRHSLHGFFLRNSVNSLEQFTHGIFPVHSCLPNFVLNGLLRMSCVAFDFLDEKFCSENYLLFKNCILLVLCNKNKPVTAVSVMQTGKNGHARLEFASRKSRTELVKGV